MTGEAGVPRFGRVRLGLIGSVSNYRLKRPVDDGSSEIPTDISGFYRILHATRDPRTP